MCESSIGDASGRGMGVAGRLLAFALLLGMGMGTALSAPPAPQAFDNRTWGQMKKGLPRPAVVVFTTTDCAFCPDVIEAVSQDLKQGAAKAGMKAALAVVVMDGARQPPAWRNEPHYAKADRLYVFRGQEMALRHGIDPRWRGMTPYLALFSGRDEPQFVVGRPTAEQMEALFRR